MVATEAGRPNGRVEVDCPAPSAHDFPAQYNGQARHGQAQAFEALLTAARESSKPCDFALVAMLSLLGLRIFEAEGLVL
jgi:hypothetical protein